MTVRLISAFIITLVLLSCSKDELNYEPSKKVDPFVIYKEGLEALISGEGTATVLGRKKVLSLKIFGI